MKNKLTIKLIGNKIQISFNSMNRIPLLNHRNPNHFLPLIGAFPPLTADLTIVHPPEISRSDILSLFTPPSSSHDFIQHGLLSSLCLWAAVGIPASSAVAVVVVKKGLFPVYSLYFFSRFLHSFLVHRGNSRVSQLIQNGEIHYQLD
jgi:hypothetical protein